MIAENVLQLSFMKKNFYRKWLNVVLAHDSNARFPLAIRIIREQNFYNE